MRNVTSLRLFSRAPRISMYSVTRPRVCGWWSRPPYPPGPALAGDARPRGHSRCRSVPGERPADELARRFIRADDDAGRRDAAVDELESAGDRPLGEQALARPDDDRKGPQPVAVDEVVTDQGLNEVAAAVDLQLGTVLLLERGDASGSIAVDQYRAIPGQVWTAARYDVLGRVV